MVSALERLVDRHGGGHYADYIVKLTFPRNPNGVYLIKGEGPKVWRVFGLPRNWRKLQGIIHGKGGGVKRWKKSQQPELPDDLMLKICSKNERDRMNCALFVQI